MQRRTAVSGLRLPVMLALTARREGGFCTQKGSYIFSFGVPAGKGQVLVRLTHRPVQTSDLSVARGLYGPRDFPSVLGGEGVGFGSLWCLLPLFSLCSQAKAACATHTTHALSTAAKVNLDVHPD